MKANQLIAGTVIMAGLIFGTSAQAQGLGGLAGHVGGALGGGAGGGMAGFNGTGGANGAINGNTLGANADGFGHASRIHTPDDSAGAATNAKSHPGRSVTSAVDTGASAAGAGTANANSKVSNAGTKPTVPNAGSTVTGAASTSGTSASTASAGAAQSASQTTASARGAQLGGGTNVSKGPVDADASGQAAANRGGINANGGASTQASVGR